MWDSHTGLRRMLSATAARIVGRTGSADRLNQWRVWRKATMPYDLTEGRRRRRLLAALAAIGLVVTLGGLARPLTARAAIGDINAFAGDGTANYYGDGGLATLASVNRVSDEAGDSAGNVYVAGGNHVIRRVDPSGIITTWAGTNDNGSG